jgi:hypothetical protein
MCNIQAQNADYLFMVEQAVKAPSGHNTQPWLFKINHENIEIHPNFEKSLPVVDPDNRELFISLGCAAENLCITASSKGYNARVSIADEGVITVYLEKKEQVKYDPLFEQIAIRQTNRSEYKGVTISADTLDILKKVPLEAGINRYFYQNASEEFVAISDFVVRGNIAQMQNKAFTDELKSWMRFNKKHSNKTNDGLSYAVFGAPNLPMFIVKPIMSGYLNDKKQNKEDIKKMQSSSHFVLFTTQSNTLEQWINLGRATERFLLKSTELKIIHAYLNQPNEIKELLVEMTGFLHIAEYPAILLRIGYGETLPYSKRKEIKDVIIYE